MKAATAFGGIMKRIGVIGIVIKGDRSVSVQVQEILSGFGELIVGRMGVPSKENNVYAISVIVSGSNEEINALSGKLGRLDNVNVKSAITSVEIE